MPWNSRACFGRKTAAGRRLCRVTECSFMNDTCTPNAVYNTAISSLGWAFLPLVDEKVFSRLLCTGHGIASVFCPAQGQGQVCPVPLLLMELPVWWPTSPPLVFCQMLALKFWQLDHKSFPGKNTRFL